VEFRGFGTIKWSGKPCLVAPHLDQRGGERARARRRQRERVSPRVLRHGIAAQQRARLQAIEDRLERRAIYAKAARQCRLTDPRIVPHQHQQPELTGTSRPTAQPHRSGEVREHRRLGATQRIAQQTRQRSTVQRRQGWTRHGSSGKRRSFGGQTISAMNQIVRIVPADRDIEVPMGGTILEAALAAGIDYPFGCQSGNCGACKSHLLSGEVSMEGFSEFALSDEERARGLILACRAVPWERCEVAWLAEEDLVVHPRRVLETRVVGLDDATHDIKRLRLAIEAGGPFNFSAGQFASLTFAGCPPRDYSMANRPDEQVLEFHIRRSAKARVSAYVAETLKVGDTVRVEGPFGASHLREQHRGPIIAVAGGSGLAPIKSIIEQALLRDLPQHIHLYIGARAERDLYLMDHFRALAERHPRLHLVTVLSDQTISGHREGLVHNAVLADFDELDGCKAYLAGPPVMVEAATRAFEARGIARLDIHADAFYTAEEMAAQGGKTGAQE